MKEIVVISGKGGTGKTSITASFASIAKNIVIADCDVDAADLHLILDPKVIKDEDFYSGHTAVIDEDKCTGCGMCHTVCKFDAVNISESGRTFIVNPVACEGCKVCVEFCPINVIDFKESNCGNSYVSETRFGPMVHARLKIAAENSGKLVSLVRTKAKEIAKEKNADIILIDGPPGTSCPVIASITGADVVVVVTEPTLSGKHDLERVAKLAMHFKIPVYLCINKWDINEQITEEIEKMSKDHDITLLGRVSYNKVFTDAQIAGKSVIEYGKSEVADEIKKVWVNLWQNIA